MRWPLSKCEVTLTLTRRQTQGGLTQSPEFYSLTHCVRSFCVLNAAGSRAPPGLPPPPLHPVFESSWPSAFLTRVGVLLTSKVAVGLRQEIGKNDQGIKHRIPYSPARMDLVPAVFWSPWPVPEIVTICSEAHHRQMQQENTGALWAETRFVCSLLSSPPLV